VTDNLQKAYLAFFEPTESGPGGEAAINGRSRITCKFNPKEYTVQKSAAWRRDNTKGAKQTSMPEFTGSEPRSLSLEIFLDETDKAGDVSKDVDTLFACLVPLQTTLSAQKPSPPFVQFGWGTTVLFTAFLKSVSAKYTLFRPTGAPVRAACTISLEEIPDEFGRQNPTSGSPNALRGHTMVEGDTLASVAYREYGNPTLWRALADANGIDDPLRVRPGTRLLVPRPDEAGKTS
jgi:nucleoid-associated protein YgaU